MTARTSHSPRSARSDTPSAVVVGAGLAGLLAGVELARAGVVTTVLDGAGHAGGRAHTTVEDGFHRNLGVHAVYRRGALARELRRIGVAVPGTSPNLARARMRVWPGYQRSAVGAAPSLAVAFARLTARPPRPGATVDEWLDAARLTPASRSAVQALVRTATYVQAPDVQDAVSAWAQVRMALAGVTYVDGGWSTLVDGLAEQFRAAGGELRTGAGVVRVDHDERRVRGVDLTDGTSLPADAVVVAVGGPRDAGRLLTGEPGARLTARDDVPVRMATLDLTLDRLPRRWPAQVFGDGGDPRYVLVQSRFARLAPAGGAVVHVARYLAPGERAGREVRHDLEVLLDEAQPGWRAVVRAARFLPDMTVTHATPLAATGGLGGRAPVTTGVPGLAIAGDAVGAEGQLADAAAASGVAAARAVLTHLHEADVPQRVDAA